jgi:hypothetical protein
MTAVIMPVGDQFGETLYGISLIGQRELNAQTYAGREAIRDLVALSSR